MKETYKKINNQTIEITYETAEKNTVEYTLSALLERKAEFQARINSEITRRDLGLKSDYDGLEKVNKLLLECEKLEIK